MHFFTRVPWVHLLFPESVVMRVRSRFRADGARKYEEVEGGLNRMSVRRFLRVMSEAGFRVVRVEYRCIRRWDWLSRVPLLRELFINRVSCIATPRVTP